MPDDVKALRPTTRAVLASNANLIAGSLIFGTLFVIDAVYQLEHRFYLQAAGAVVLVGLIAYGLVNGLTTALNGRDMPARRHVDGWVPPRSPAVVALLAVCVLATLVGWILPNHWNIERGTVGRVGVWQHHEWWRLVTSAFLHASPLHLYYNMLALWFLGREIDGTLGTTRFLTIYFVSALGGGLTVVAVGQEHTLGASGAIYGLMGASLYFGIHAFRAGHRNAAKLMLITTGGLVGLNLLLSFSIPNISLAAHVGGLITGFFVAMLVGFPSLLNDAWAMSDRCPSPACFTYDVNAARFSYHGPVDFALAAGLVEPSAMATTTAAGWSPYLNVSDLDPRTPIDAYVDDPYRLLKSADTPQPSAVPAY